MQQQQAGPAPMRSALHGHTAGASNNRRAPLAGAFSTSSARLRRQPQQRLAERPQVPQRLDDHVQEAVVEAAVVAQAAHEAQALQVGLLQQAAHVAAWRGGRVSPYPKHRGSKHGSAHAVSRACALACVPQQAS